MTKFRSRTQPRSLLAQTSRMRRAWPDFEFMQRESSIVTWRGPLKGFQKVYNIGILWDSEDKTAPYVFLIDPQLCPREGTTFEHIPHLWFDTDNPERSGLCLFDPEGNEWNNHMFIADTTLPWAAKWLYFYELWHEDGEWRGGGVGPESVAKTRP